MLRTHGFATVADLIGGYPVWASLGPNPLTHKEPCTVFRRSTVPATTPLDAHDRPGGDALVDVREPHEWAAGHAPGAVHLPLGELHPDRLPAAERLLCICRSGARSSQAVAALRNAGYEAVNVDGGMNAWHAHGLPVVRDDGHPGTVA